MEKLLHYLPLYFLGCLIVGISLQFYGNIWQFGFIKLALLFLAFLLILALLHKQKKKKSFSLFSLFFFVFIGVSSVFVNNYRNYKHYYGYAVDKNSVLILTIKKVLKPGNYYNKYQAKVSQVDQQKTIGDILLNIQKDSLHNTLKVDQQIFLKPILKNINPPQNPHQFNYKSYLKKQEVYHQIFTNKQHYREINKGKFSLLGLSARGREKIQKSLKNYHFNHQEFAVINALLLGQRQEISKELLQNYSRAGAIHILAVSGLHIGIILLILHQLFKKLNSTRKGILIRTILILLLLWVFAFIAGLSASVVRAVTMFTFVTIGQSFKRKKVVEHSLIASMLFLLLIKPMFLFDVGFQLSYLAVFGIVWVQPLIYNLWKPKFNFINKGWQLFSVSIAAQAGILPISLYYFHQFPSLFILSNIIIIPFLGFILLGGICVIFLSLINTLPQFVADTYGFIISLMNGFVSWVSAQEKFIFNEISMSFTVMLIWYIVIFLGIKFFIKKTPKSLVLLLISIVFMQFLLLFDDFNKNNKQEFIVFHKSREPILGFRKGKELLVYHNLNAAEIKKERLIMSYKIGEDISLKYTNKVPNIFKFNKQTILRIDSLGAYKIPKLQQSLVLLQYSPKINLTRLIKEINPTQVIADGSNYKSYITLWQAICLREKITFHYTGQNGAFILKK